jgi:hypothetical protein
LLDRFRLELSSVSLARHTSSSQNTLSGVYESGGVPGTLPIDQAKGKFGLSKDDVHTIKSGVNAKPSTWTGIAPNGDVWVGTPDGKGTNEGPLGTYLPGG